MPASACMYRRPPRPTRFPYPTLFRSIRATEPVMAMRNRKSKSSVQAPSSNWPSVLENSAVPAVAWVTDTAGTAGEILVARARPTPKLDRKSTRLNSSHVEISYAGFCLHVPATTQTDTLSLPDALPIYQGDRAGHGDEEQEEQKLGPGSLIELAERP